MKSSSLTICCEFYIHLSLLANQMSQVGSPVVSPSCTSRAFDILAQCLNIPILEQAEVIQGLNALVFHHCLGSACTAPKVFKNCSHACLHCLSFLFFHLVSLTSQKRYCIGEAQVFHMPFLGFQALPKVWSEILVSCGFSKF